VQWRSEGTEGADRPGRQSGGLGKRVAKMGVIRGASGISRVLGMAILQSVPDADNSSYAPLIVCIKGQNLLHHFPRSKSVTSWRGQKSLVSVVSCRFPIFH